MKPSQFAGWCLVAVLLAGGLAISQAGADTTEQAPADTPAKPVDRGAAIYAKQCAECHGDKGQGVEGAYEKPLAGERTLAWLTRRVERTMPEGEAEKCVGEDAAAVAQYLHDRFYSPKAPGNLVQKPKQLQHLTVEQHRQTLADLIGSFRQQSKHGEARGLRAQYYPGRKMRGKPLAELTEPTLDIAYTDKHPLHEQFDERGHSVRWSGSVLASNTGWYEIVVRTDHAMRLWLNDGSARGGGIGNEMSDVEKAFIDGWVMSKDKEEFRKRVYLLAGRAYPVMLEFSSHTQGVGRDEWHKRPGAARSYVSLGWVPPGGIEEVIPQRHLSPQRSAEVFALSTRFPADDASMGYERGALVSQAWLSAVTDAAVETANYIVDNADELIGTKLETAKADKLSRSFSRKFVERAYRRPLSEAEVDAIDRQFDASPSVEAAVKRVVIGTLSSPRFLYPEAGSREPDSYTIASRLALTLWDSLPDQGLWASAGRGELTDPAKVRAHAMRMLDDPRAERKLKRFFHHWLELERAEDIAKDAERFPEFDDHLLADLRVSLELFLDDVLFGERSDYRELLLADYLYLNPRLADVYGYERDEQAGEGFIRVSVSDGKRSGVITHPYLLTAFAYHESTSPIHRGVFLTRNVIGRPLNPPPNAIAFEDAEFDPTLTMREKVTAFTRDSACMACHATINPLGFSLEHYDSIGRWRTEERGKPIDAESDFTGDDGETVKLKGARDVAEFAAGSDLARRGFVRQLLLYTAKQEPNSFRPGLLDRLDKRFVENNMHIRRLFADIAVYTCTDDLPEELAKLTDEPVPNAGQEEPRP